MNETRADPRRARESELRQASAEAVSPASRCWTTPTAGSAGIERAELVAHGCGLVVQQVGLYPVHADPALGGQPGSPGGPGAKSTAVTRQPRLASQVAFRAPRRILGRSPGRAAARPVPSRRSGSGPRPRPGPAPLSAGPRPPARWLPLSLAVASGSGEGEEQPLQPRAVGIGRAAAVGRALLQASRDDLDPRRVKRRDAAASCVTTSASRALPRSSSSRRRSGPAPA